jgi:hypothetical protein
MASLEEIWAADDDHWEKIMVPLINPPTSARPLGVLGDDSEDESGFLFTPAAFPRNAHTG